jgi:hypothetical protein
MKHLAHALLLAVAIAPPEGSRMPLAGPPLTVAEIQRIRDWIGAGAPP